MTLFRSSSVHETLLNSQNARRPTRPATSNTTLRAQPHSTASIGDSHSAPPLPRPTSNARMSVAYHPEDQQPPVSASMDYTAAPAPTYYDVLKCRGEFAMPSAFFTRPVKPAHSSASTYPWATQPASIPTTSGQQDSSKHRLRRSVAGGGSSLDTSSVASSSVFGTAHTDNALPPSVFRLPGSRPSTRRAGTSLQEAEDPWALAGMTAGGRALRRADQLILSQFDRKLTLV
ncbi:hypothetical protein IW140_002596 [Coemansia sp. RSA 1813]|nr:hypothetical protein EV178_002076 [Coemansia sp. RSA 1646]KAJ1772705.1 hypothetical protein LPJ74_001231 [Coemansia sp. RSA 1843]KAJ2090656.1 hypothetical protein IW138_002470 [Coemansia sp. RSA 986]KAJ2216140.1 hypothetical protein EV179_001600 [Coemansia sp. RSA 487]KAJ2570126.1 hypothetical protein IW140_002596 [Coemansia sp. RSA 1813]